MDSSRYDGQACRDVAYRAQRRDPNALTVRRNASRQDLPRAALRAIEQVQQEPSRDHEEFDFYRDPVGVEPLGPLLRRGASQWAALQLVTFVLLMLALRSIGAAAFGLGWLVLSAASAAWTFRPTLQASKRNRRRKIQGGSHAFGVYLLEEGVVVHQPDGTHYLPHRAVQEVLAIRRAAEPQGRLPKPARTDVTVTYRDHEGDTQGLAISPAPFAGHDPLVVRALQGWLHGTSAAEVERFGEVPPADLARREWAKAWRRFWRLRGSAQIATTVATVLVIVWIFFAGRTPLVTVALLASWAATSALRLKYASFRCPRCGLSPNQPLRGGGARHCLNCGLPIYTTTRALPEAKEDPSPT